MTFRLHTSISVLILAVLGLCSAVRAETSQIEDLKGIWKDRRDSLYTIKIVARVFRTGGSRLNALSPNEVAIVFNGIEPNSAESLTEAISGLSAIDLQGGPFWSEYTLAYDGQRQAEIEGHGHEHRVIDHRADAILLEAAGQVSLAAPGDTPRYILSLANFCYEFFPFVRRPLNVTHASDRHLTLRSNLGRPEQALELLVDQQTKCVVRATIFDGETIVSQSLQSQPLNPTSNAPLPAVRLDATYHHGALSYVRLIAVRSLTINEQLPENLFQIASDKQTKVFDRRTGVLNYKELSEPTQDVVAAMDASPTRRMPIEPVAGGSDSSKWVLVNIFVVVVLAILVSVRYFRRYKMKRPV